MIHLAVRALLVGRSMVAACGVAGALLVLGLWPGSRTATIVPRANAATTIRHVELLASVPGNGDTLSVTPAAVRLTFSEPIEVVLVRLVVLRNGADPIPLSARADPTDVHTISSETPRLEPGAYRIGWRVVSADGHPVESSFVFFILADGSFLGDPPPEIPFSADGHTSQRVRSVSMGLLRGAAMGALLTLAGLLLIQFTTRDSAPAPQRANVARMVPSQAQLVALAFLTLGLFTLRLALWSTQATVLPLSAAVPVILESTVGRIEMSRLAAMALSVWALALARRLDIAAVFAAIAVILSGAVGHALATAPLLSVPMKAVHLVFAAVWLGGVLQLGFSALRPGTDHAEVLRISRWALIAVVVIALSGAIQTFVLIARPSALLSSMYGRLVLVKVCALAALVAFGARNRFELVPGIRHGEPLAGGGRATSFNADDPSRAMRELRRNTRIESLIVLATVLVAGVLAHTSPPLSLP